MVKDKIGNILHVGTYPPRECGIATFTKDLTDALNLKFNPEVKSKITAINDSTNFYNYKKNVLFQIDQTNREDYINLAHKINIDPKITLVHLQHEFGIYGGSAGRYIVDFLNRLEKPILTTLHTVVPRPNLAMRETLVDIVDKSYAVIVMSNKAQKILGKNYKINISKINVIPHGVPQVPFVSPGIAKRKLGLAGKIVLSTFGMLNPNKGIEYAISALPSVLKKFPNLIYLVIGATHPVVRKKTGEDYRNFLRDKVDALGLTKWVKFYNKYISLNEIIDYLQATDIYISPTLDQFQTVSGTISYALGCGRPVISTASTYAKEVVTRNSGKLVKFRDSESISGAILTLLSKSQSLIETSQSAYANTRQMTWANVATSHFDLYKKYTRLKVFETKFPKIKLLHLKRLSSDFGIWQFARFTRPDKKYGYCLDDNTRALIVACMYYKYSKQKFVLDLVNTYLSFIGFCQTKNGKFHNFINSKRIFYDKIGSEDSFGRAIWALGYCASQKKLPRKIRISAENLLKRSIGMIDKIKSLRARSFIAAGIYHYNQKPNKSKFSKIIKKFADHQMKLYREIFSTKWKWFENQLTYSNSKLIDTLLYEYLLSKKERYLSTALECLKFLKSITISRKYFSPIGQSGWYVRGGKRSHFDQQAEDTSSMASTLLLAYKITRNRQYLEDATAVFNWFLGKNSLRQMIYDEVTGGCFDGLGKYSVNLNQGAESTISYLLARLTFEEYKDRL